MAKNNYKFAQVGKFRQIWSHLLSFPLQVEPLL